MSVPVQKPPPMATSPTAGYPVSSWPPWIGAEVLETSSTSEDAPSSTQPAPLIMQTARPNEAVKRPFMFSLSHQPEAATRGTALDDPAWAVLARRELRRCSAFFCRNFRRDAISPSATTGARAHDVTEPIPAVAPSADCAPGARVAP